MRCCRYANMWLRVTRSVEPNGGQSVVLHRVGDWFGRKDVGNGRDAGEREKVGGRVMVEK
jgi:hypothetical protein